MVACHSEGVHPLAPSFLGAGDFTYRFGPVPVFVAAEGCRLVDADGNTYLDAEAANGAAVLGYDASLLSEAMARCARLPALPSFCESDLRLGVAAELERRISAAVGVPGRVAFEVGGAQGIELALKVVAANRGWDQAVTLEGGYHGRTPFTGQLSASARYRRPLPSHGTDVVRLPLPDCEQCPLGSVSASCEDGCARLIDHYGSEQSGVALDRVSALLLEPVLNAGGMVRPHRAFLDKAVEHFRAGGALVVVDEVFTGFWRTGREFGLELEGLQPDVVVVSKGLTNGIAPLSAVWAREPLLDGDHFPPGTHSSTFAGAPFGLAVADAVLSRFADAARWTAALGRLQDGLGALVEELATAFPGTVRSGYALGGIARLLLHRPAAREVRRAALAPRSGPVDGVRGALVASTGMAPDVVALHPPLTIERDDLAILGELLHRALREVERA